MTKERGQDLVFVTIVLSVAFHVGLMEELPALVDFIQEDHSLYGPGFGAAELRALLVRRDWPSFIGRTALTAQLQTLIDIAERGLVRRGLGEERYLNPLRRRAETLRNPARDQLDRLSSGESVDQIAEDYGSL